MSLKSIVVAIILVLPSLSFAAAKKITYFSCPIKEKISGRNHEVTVKFGIENYDAYADTGELIQYAGADEDVGAILIDPVQVGERYTRMSNLNGQGGDLRLENGNVRLFGDGDGYQYTDLVLWDVDTAIGNEATTVDGYVRDYGPAYGDEPDFKQFITCQISNKKL